MTPYDPVAVDLKNLAERVGEAVEVTRLAALACYVNPNELTQRLYTDALDRMCLAWIAQHDYTTHLEKNPCPLP